MSINPRERITELVEIIREANKKYHTEDDPIMSDFEYDKLFAELVDLEKKYPEYASETSPTKDIGAEVIDSFKKVKHDIPMMSLSNMFNEDDVRKFYKRITEAAEKPQDIISELKIDGLGISLIYEDGEFKQAITRGDGMIGEDVTHNVKTIKSLPLKLTEPVDITVRGEIIITDEVFERINQERFEQGLPLFANSRNVAAGTIRQLDSKVAEEREMELFVYTLVNDIEGISTQTETLEYLTRLGFPVNVFYKLHHDLDSMIESLESYKEIRSMIEYRTDGIVFKVNDKSLYDKIGYTSRTPKWASAFKFPPEEKSTLLKDITYQVGRTGKITPVAELEPIFLDGSLVSRATLHNEDMITEKDLRIGDTVVIVKAGDIIPHILRVDTTKPRGSDKFEMIKKCPDCGSTLERQGDKADYFCLNDSCSSKIINRLIHFASRDAIDIKGLGPRLIETLYTEDLLTSLTDFYSLHNYRDKLINIEGLGEKSVDSLIDSIVNSKKDDPARLLYALGIKGIGLVNARAIMEKVKNINDIKYMSVDSLTDIPGVGPILAANIVRFFNEEKNKEELETFKNYGFKMEMEEPKPVRTDTKLSGKTVVLTGTFEGYSRKDLTEIVRDMGANVSSSVSSKTDFVISGEASGSKRTRAEELGIQIIEQKDFEDYGIE